MDKRDDTANGEQGAWPEDEWPGDEAFAFLESVIEEMERCCPCHVSILSTEMDLNADFALVISTKVRDE